MRSIALDLGVRETAFCEVADGVVVARRKVADVTHLADILGPERGRARVAIESCREAWHVHDTLTKWGHDVLLVDTTRTRQIGLRQHGRKTDRIDAELLARAVENGSLPLAHLLSPARRQLRDLLSVRRALVETRAQYITTIRGLARSRGEKIGTCAADGFISKLEKAGLGEETSSLIAPLHSALGRVHLELLRANAQLEALSRSEPVIERLTSAPGVGLVVAAAFVSVVDDAKRFASAHQVESYLGLVPREHSSGGKRKLGSITKSGNGYMRALLVQSASSVLRVGDPDDPLRKWGRMLVERRGRKIAVVAVARRLSGILWAMWRKASAYDAGRLGCSSARGLERRAKNATREASAMLAAAQKTERRTRSTARALAAADAKERSM